MDQSSFIFFLQNTRSPHRDALFRLLFNQLCDARAYPFSLSELLRLPPTVREPAIAFLDGCAARAAPLQDLQANELRRLWREGSNRKLQANVP